MCPFPSFISSFDLLDWCLDIMACSGLRMKGARQFQESRRRRKNFVQGIPVPPSLSVVSQITPETKDESLKLWYRNIWRKNIHWKHFSTLWKYQRKEFLKKLRLDQGLVWLFEKGSTADSWRKLHAQVRAGFTTLLTPTINSPTLCTLVGCPIIWFNSGTN